MNNLSQNFEGGHPPQDQFLQFVDGELAPKDMALWQSHLDACWSCRVRCNKIEETITSIIEFEDTVSDFQSTKSNQRWGSFNSQLNSLAQETKPKRGFRSYWNNLTNFFSNYSLAKVATTSIAALLLIAIIYQFVLVTPVSASQLLEKAKESNQEKISSVNNPVVYQKLKVSSGEKSSTVELWNQVETKKGRESGATTDVFNDYKTILAANRIDSNKPLSAEAYQLWSNKLAKKQESVSQSKTADGETAYELTTITGQDKKTGEITQANLIVRESDWHTVSQKIQVKTDGEDKTFEISELEFRVINSNTLAKDFFGADTTASKITPGQSIVPTPNASPETEEVNTNTNVATALPANTNVNAATAATAPNGTASVDLEVEVLAKLNQLNALTGEQIDLSRTPDGKLLLKGIVDTKERKTEILQALDSYRSNPAVKIDIQSVDEIKVKQSKSQPANITIQNVEVTAPKFPVEDELQKYFITSRGMSAEQADTQIRQLSGNVLAASGQARSSASALKQIAGRFANQDMSKMDDAARAKWRGLIAGHARSAERSLQNLKQQLRGIFPTSAADGASGMTASSDEEIQKSAQQLFELIIKTDDGLRRSFSLSNDSKSSAPVQSPDFWQSFGKAEKIAAQLATIK